MEDIRYTTEAITGLFLQGMLMIVLPAILLIIWEVRTRENVIPVIVGAAVFFLFAIVLKIAPAYFLLQHDNPVAKAITGNLWLTYLTVGLLAGVFEETGRFLAFKTVLKKYDRKRSSISYGIGHGGFESMYIAGSTITMAVLGILVNSGHMDLLMSQGMDESASAAMTAQLSSLAGATLGECLLGVFERISAIVAHISFSVLVFAAAREKKYFILYPLAVILHALFDFCIVFYANGTLPVLAMEAGLAVVAAVLAIFARVIYKRYEK